MNANPSNNWLNNAGQTPQFGLLSMAIFTAFISVFVVVRMWSVPLATTLIPIIVGGSTAYACTHDPKSMIIGGLSALFWSMLLIFFLFGFGQQYFPSQFFEMTLSECLLVLVSLAGGYLGAVVHRH